MTRRMFLILTLAVTLAGCALRVTHLAGALEYDEIWTLENYANASLGRIFTDLSLPNNHPLNSLAVKLTAGADRTPLLRLVPLTAGIALIPLTGMLALLLFRRRRAALWSMLIVALAAPAAEYAQAARGYSLQLALLAGFGVALLRWCRQPDAWRWSFTAAGCGIAAELTLSPSVLTLFPAAATALAVLVPRFRRMDAAAWKKMLPALAGLGLLGLFSLAWYLGNYRQFQAGRQWGAALHCAGDWLRWSGGVLRQLGIPLPAVAVALLLLRRRRSLYLLLPTLLLPLLAAPLTNGGPARTMLPLLVGWALIAGAALAELRRLFGRRRLRCWWPPVAAALCGALVWQSVDLRQSWRPTDWYQLFQMAERLPPEYLTVYTATDSYPLAWNNRPDAYRDFMKRLLARSAPQRLLLIGPHGDALNGTDRNGAEQRLPLPFAGRFGYAEDLWQGTAFALEELSGAPPPGAVVLAIIRPLPEAAAAVLGRRLTDAGYPWLTLNFWLTVEVTRRENVYRYYLLGTIVDDPGRLDWAELLRQSRGALRFLQVRPLPE